MNSEESIRELTENLIKDSAIFLVDLKIKPGNNIKIFLDGDNGINIDSISKINRSLHQTILEEKIFPDDDFSLEVSSPGIDTPLKLHRQYPKNIGRLVNILLSDDTTIIKGTLIAVEETTLTIEKEVRKNKKQDEEKTVIIPFDKIKSTTVELNF